MTKLKPFKVLKEEVVAEIGPHSFIKATLKAPNGKEVVWSYMQASDAVGILPLDQHHNVYLVKEWRAVRKDFVWSIPTGKVEESNPTEEDFENTANRELQEEAGVKARKLEKLGSYLTSEHMTRKFHVYLATELEASSLPPDEGEYLEVKKLPFTEAFNFVIKN